MTQIEFLIEAAKQEVQYQIQFVDYSPDEWISPCILTPMRLAILLDDSSVKRIRLEFNIE